MYVSFDTWGWSNGCGIHHWIVTCSPEHVAWYISSGLGAFPRPTTSGDRICRWSHHIYILRCVLCQQLPADFLPFVPLQDTTVALYLSLYACIVHCASGFFPSVISSSSESTKSEPPIRTLRDAEHSAVESNAEGMDIHALAWLFNMSSNPSVKTIVIQSTGILPLASVSL